MSALPASGDLQTDPSTVAAADSESDSDEDAGFRRRRPKKVTPPASSEKVDEGS